MFKFNISKHAKKKRLYNYCGSSELYNLQAEVRFQRDSIADPKVFVQSEIFQTIL